MPDMTSPGAPTCHHNEQRRNRLRTEPFRCLWGSMPSRRTCGRRGRSSQSHSISLPCTTTCPRSSHGSSSTRRREPSHPQAGSMPAMRQSALPGNHLPATFETLLHPQESELAMNIELSLNWECCSWPTARENRSLPAARTLGATPELTGPAGLKDWGFWPRLGIRNGQKGRGRGT